MTETPEERAKQVFQDLTKAQQACGPFADKELLIGIITSAIDSAVAEAREPLERELLQLREGEEREE